jgi:hypothetical protein
MRRCIVSNFLFKFRCEPVCRCPREDLCCDERLFTVRIKRLVKKRRTETRSYQVSSGFFIVLARWNPRSVKFWQLQSTKNARFFLAHRI